MNRDQGQWSIETTAVNGDTREGCSWRVKSTTGPVINTINCKSSLYEEWLFFSKLFSLSFFSQTNSPVVENQKQFSKVINRVLARIIILHSIWLYLKTFCNYYKRNTLQITLWQIWDPNSSLCTSTHLLEHLNFELLRCLQFCFIFILLL